MRSEGGAQHSVCPGSRADLARAGAGGLPGLWPIRAGERLSAAPGSVHGTPGRCLHGNKGSIKSLQER